MDNVNHPGHYTSGGIECIDAIRASLGDKEFADYCKGNIIKYLWRYRLKNGVEDLHKAQVYLNWMIEAEERERSARAGSGEGDKEPSGGTEEPLGEGLEEIARLTVCTYCALPEGLCLNDNCEELNRWLTCMREVLGHAHD